MSHKHDITEDPIKLVGIAAISASIGAAVAMLISPRKGSDIRGGINRRAHNAAQNVQDRFTSDDAEDAVGDVRDRMHDVADEAAAKAKSTTQRVKRVVKDAADDVT